MNPSELDLLTLRCFLEAAKRMNFRAAASSLHMSPAALGKRIAALERQLGVKLFERSTRRMMLTISGSQAVPKASRLLEDCARFASEFSACSPAAYTLTIATRFEIGLSWLTPALEALSKKQPQRVMHLSFGDSVDMIARVQSGQVDAAITSSRQRPPGFQHMDLHQEECVFVGCTSLLRALPVRSAEDAASHTLLDIDSTRPLFQCLLDAQDERTPWLFQETRYLGTIGAIRQRVLGGHGLAVLPLYFVTPDLEQSKLVHVIPSTRLRADPLRLIWLADQPRVDELQALGEDLRTIPLEAVAARHDP